LITSIIIDDEAKARSLMNSIISQYIPEVVVLESCNDLPSGIKAIKKLKPDLVFLDIEMPGHSGLELMDFFEPEEVSFGIIFTTAYNEYAVQAFKFSAVDYLLKPIQHNQLIDAISRYKQKGILHSKQLLALQQNIMPSNSLDDKRIVVAVGQSYKLLNPRELIMIKGDGAYSEIFMEDGNKILASKNLKHFEDTLQRIPFMFRCHKSFLVNLNFVDEYVKSEGGFLKLKKGLEAGISVDKVEEFLSRIV
jgi:two-component system, LytTR family, response regulator